MKVVFIHIPKTAGGSIEQTLRHNKDIEYIQYQHSTPTELVAKIGLADWISSFKFTVVRNVFDRFVSGYYYLHNHNSLINDRPGVELVHSYKDIHDFIHNCNSITQWLHFRPQIQWLTHELDIIINFNSIPEYIFNTKVLNNVNKSEHKHWKEILTEKDIEKLTEIYNDDIIELRKIDEKIQP